MWTVQKLCKVLDASQDESEQAGPEKTITDEDMAARFACYIDLSEA